MNTQVTDSQVTSAQEGSLVLLKTKATWLATHLCTIKKFPKKRPRLWEQKTSIGSLPACLALPRCSV